MSTFRVQGATPGALVTVPYRLVRIGDAVPVSFHAGGPAAAVAVERLHGRVATVVAERHVAGGRGICAVRFSSAGWKAGAYAAVLPAPDGRVRSRFPFWVAAPALRPSCERRSRCSRSVSRSA